MLNSLSLSLAFLKYASLTFDYLIDALSLTSYTVIDASGTLLGTYSNTGSSSGLKAAIDSVKAEGKHLLFVGGETYRFLDNVEGQDHAAVDGLVGLTLSSDPADRATIEGLSNAAEDAGPLSFSGCDRTTLRDLIVNGLGSSRAGSHALLLENSDHVTLENVRIIGSRGAGIVFDAASASSDNNAVRNCDVSGTQAGDGIRFLAATGCVVEDTLIHDCAGAGVHIEDATGVAVKGCTVESNDLEGIHVLSSDACLIGSVAKSNLIRDNAVGVRIGGSGSAGNVVEFSVITDTRTGDAKTQVYGVQIGAGATGTIVRNNLLGGNKTAPLSDGGTDSVITNNS